MLEGIICPVCENTLDEVDLRTNAEKGQPELFYEDFGQLDNCEGMCGV